MLLKPVSSRGPLSLSQEAASPPPELASGGKLEAKFEKVAKRLGELQQVLYADGRHSLLIVLQGRDAAGKDSVTASVFDGCNAQGVRVNSFKAPTSSELAHDYLWRIHNVVPERRMIGIFNRSHYEDVLVVRVHNLVPKEVWSKRYDRINTFERDLAEHGTHILKFYLHISREEQLCRFKERFDDPTKQWKISEADYAERKFWREYMVAYEDALSQCSSEGAPWFVIPANHKWFRNLAVARIVVEYLEGLGLSYPKPSVDIARIRSEYHSAESAARSHRR